MDPVSMGMTGASLLSGFLGGDGAGELSPEMARIFAQFQRLFREQRQYGKGIPGSDPGEQAVLAQQKALAGEGIGQQYEGLLASLGTDNPNAGDALSTFRGNTAGTMAGIDMTMLLEFLKNRQNAKWGGAQSALSGAMGAASSPRTGGGGDLSGLFSQLGNVYAQSKYKPQSPFNFNINGLDYGGSRWNAPAAGGGAEPGGGNSGAWGSGGNQSDPENWR
jgi:hypothetical protein